jgi:hypothetical protein
MLTLSLFDQSNLFGLSVFVVHCFYCVHTISDIECGECKQLVIPETSKHYVFETLHNLSGHQGTERTLALLQRRCYWSGMVNDVKQWSKICERCLVAKNPFPKVYCLCKLSKHIS